MPISSQGRFVDVNRDRSPFDRQDYPIRDLSLLGIFLELTQSNRKFRPAVFGKVPVTFAHLS
jgi:hypothetical protein